VTATQFNGPVNGNVTGNLAGNVTGNVSGTAANVTGTVAVANGGTGATTAAGALANILPGVSSDGSSGFQVAGKAQFNGAVGVSAAGIKFSDNSVQSSSQQGALTGLANDATARGAAASAQTAAATAETDAQTGIANAAKAETDAQSAMTSVATAQSAATAAQTAAGSAETDAQTGITNAAKAETDAQTGMANAAVAQAAANAAQVSANNSMSGQGNDATARSAAATAESDAQAGIAGAGKAETDAQSAIASAATAQSSAASAETDAQAGIANAAAALAAANAAQVSAASALNGQGNDSSARSAAAVSETDAQTGIANAATAQSAATSAQSAAAIAETDAQTGIANAGKAETDAQTAITNAAAAQTAAVAAQAAAAAAQTETEGYDDEMDAVQTASSSALNGEANDSAARTAAAAAQSTANAALQGGGQLGGAITFPAGTPAAPSTPQLGTWQSLGRSAFPVSAYGATGYRTVAGAAVDDGPAIQAALDAAAAFGSACSNGATGVVVFDSRKYTVKTPLTWDPSVTSIEGNGAFIDASSAAFSGPLITVAQSHNICPNGWGTASYSNAGVTYLRNMRLQGPGALGARGNVDLFWFESSETTGANQQSDTYNSRADIDHISARGFRYMENYGSNAYLVHVTNFSYVQCGTCIYLGSADNMSNSGEKLTHAHGYMAQSDLHYYGGLSYEMYFEDVSFDSGPTGQSIDNVWSRFSCLNCHFEQAAALMLASSTYILQENSGGSVLIRDSSLQFDDGAQSQGCILDARNAGTILLDGVYLNALKNTANQLACTGTGPVTIKDSRPSLTSNVLYVRSFNANNPSVNRNSIFNDGSFESGNLTSDQIWLGADTAAIVSRTAGSNCTLSNSTAAAEYGTHSLAIAKTGGAGTACGIWIAGPVSPGQIVAGSGGWYDKPGSQTGTMTVTKYWLEMQGNNASGIPMLGAQEVLNTSGGPQAVVFTASPSGWTSLTITNADPHNHAPAYANYVGIYYDLTQMNAGTVYIDGVLMDPL
jgi:hypothetical protein